MTFSYTAGGGTKDDVRLLIGDVDANASEELRLEDEDIDRLIVLEGGIRRSAASAADVLSAKFARKAEGSAGPDRITVTSRAAELRATATRLRSGAAGLAIPTAGGLSKTSKQTAEQNTDRVSPAFKTGMLDNSDASPTEPR